MYSCDYSNVITIIGGINHQVSENYSLNILIILENVEWEYDL